MDKEIRLGRFDKWGYKNSFSKGELARELTYMNRDYDKLEQKCKKQKEVIDNINQYIKDNSYKIEWGDGLQDNESLNINDDLTDEEFIMGLLDILKEVSE